MTHPCPEEIDIVATDKGEEQFIIGECKFRTELFDNCELRKLKGKIDFPGKHITTYFRFQDLRMQLFKFLIRMTDCF